jgi:hypothetical protein
MSSATGRLIRIAGIFAALTLILPNIALAQFYTGNTFKPLLDAHKRMDNSVTEGNFVNVGLGIRAEAYVSAVWDSVMGQNMVCNPTQVTGKQLVAIVSQYVDSRPQDWGYPAYVLSLTALITAFPCQRPTPAPQTAPPTSR